LPCDGQIRKIQVNNQVFQIFLFAKLGLVKLMSFPYKNIFENFAFADSTGNITFLFENSISKTFLLFRGPKKSVIFEYFIFYIFLFFIFLEKRNISEYFTSAISRNVTAALKQPFPFSSLSH
jgi:predicted PurR-regulated permease PerM